MKHFIFSLLALLLVGGLAQAQNLPPPSDSGSSSDPLPLLRNAHGRVVVIKSEMVIDQKTGKSSVTRSVVCSQLVDVPVFSANSDFYIYQPVYAYCETDSNGQKNMLSSSAAIMYVPTTLFPDSKQEQFKTALISNYFNYRSDIPAPPSQNTMTRDLKQKSFIFQLSTEQYALCTNPNPSGGTTTPPDSNAGDCNIVNPIIYSVTWDIEDDKQ